MIHIIYLLCIILNIINSCFACMCYRCTNEIEKNTNILSKSTYINQDCFIKNSSSKLVRCDTTCETYFNVIYHIDESIRHENDLQIEKIFVKKSCNRIVSKKYISKYSWKIKYDKLSITFHSYCSRNKCNDIGIYEEYVKHRSEFIVPSCRICEQKNINYNIISDCRNKENIKMEICFGKCFNILYYNKDKNIFLYKRNCITNFHGEIPSENKIIKNYGFWKYFSCSPILSELCNIGNGYITHLSKKFSKEYKQPSSENVCMVCSSIRGVNEDSSSCEKGIVDNMFELINCEEFCSEQLFIDNARIQISRGCEGSKHFIFSNLEKVVLPVPRTIGKEKACFECDENFKKMNGSLYSDTFKTETASSLEECKMNCYMVDKLICTSLKYNEINKKCFLNFDDNFKILPFDVDSVSFILIPYNKICQFNCLLTCEANKYICNNNPLSSLKEKWLNLFKENKPFNSINNSLENIIGNSETDDIYNMYREDNMLRNIDKTVISNNIKSRFLEIPKGYNRVTSNQVLRCIDTCKIRKPMGLLFIPKNFKSYLKSHSPKRRFRIKYYAKKILVNIRGKFIRKIKPYTSYLIMTAAIYRMYEVLANKRRLFKIPGKKSPAKKIYIHTSQGTHVNLGLDIVHKDLESLNNTIVESNVTLLNEHATKKLDKNEKIYYIPKEQSYIDEDSEVEVMVDYDVIIRLALSVALILFICIQIWYYYTNIPDTSEVPDQDIEYNSIHSSIVSK